MAHFGGNISTPSLMLPTCRQEVHSKLDARRHAWLLGAARARSLPEQMHANKGLHSSLHNWQGTHVWLQPELMPASMGLNATALCRMQVQHGI